MKFRRIALTLLLAAAGLVLAPVDAQAHRGDPGCSCSREYPRGRRSDEIRRREILRERTFELTRDVQRAERRGEISRADANQLYRELDYVRRFLRNDGYLSPQEFDRRMRELNRVEDQLDRWCSRHHPGRGRVHRR